MLTIDIGDTWETIIKILKGDRSVVEVLTVRLIYVLKNSVMLDVNSSTAGRLTEPILSLEW